MKKLILVMVLAAAAAALSCNRTTEKATPDAAPETAPAAAPASGGESEEGQKQTWIYFTKNHGKGEGSPYNTECIGIVGTERIGAKKGHKIMWHVRKNNGQNDDDKCEMLDVEKVNLRFQTDVMGKAVMKKLTANPGGVIQGEVSMSDDDLGAVIDHKYWVYIGEEKAGPDPVIIVGCSSCGPPPTP